MATRRETSSARRTLFHRRRISEAVTAAARLRAAFAWLMAEARKADRVNEVTLAVLDLVERVQQRLPMPDAPHNPASSTTYPSAPSDTDRREVA